MADDNSRRLAPRIAALAVAAIVIAGGIGLYVMGRTSGNIAPETAAANNSDDTSCQGKTDKAKTVASAATGEVAAMLAADPPRDLSALSFDAPDGSPITVADRSGKIVLLNLWATWCAPCRSEMPALDKLQADMGSDDFEVVSVNVDTGDDAKPKKFLSEVGVETLGYYRDHTLGLFNELKRRSLALGLPVTLLIDRDGCLLTNMNGPAEWASDDAKKLVETAVNS